MDTKGVLPDFIMETTKEMIKNAGFPIHMGTKYCNDFLESHGDKCFGCESEEGCRKLNKMARLILVFTISPSDSEEEFVANVLAFKRTTELIMKKG